MFLFEGSGDSGEVDGEAGPPGPATRRWEARAASIVERRSILTILCPWPPET